MAKAQAEINVKEDLLDLFSKIEYSYFADNGEDIEQFNAKAENVLDVACDYIKAGLFEDALYALNIYNGEYPLIEYYKAYCMAMAGENAAAFIAKAEGFGYRLLFPIAA